MSDYFHRDHSLLDRLVSLEAFLVQLVIYLLLWLWNDYLALILSLILGGIALSVLIIAKLVEWVERSRVPRNYYRLMLYCVLAPLLAGVAGVLLRNGMSWLN